MKTFAGLNAAKARILPVLALLVILVSGLILPVLAESPHLKMGNPSSAKADPDQKDNFLMEKDYFALSYNNSKGTPNWVSWRLVKDDIGKADPVQFYPDKALCQAP